MFIENQNSILEWYLMNDVTLMTVIPAENVALHHRNKLNFKIY